MTDEKPELNTTEMRQGNSRKMNLRVLIFAMAILVVGFALAIWFSAQTYDETATTTQGGETQSEASPATADPELEEAPLPVPETEENLVEDGAEVIEGEPAASGEE